MSKLPFAHLVEGARVVLNATGRPGKWEPEELHGAHGRFLGFSKPHGYARVQFDNESAPFLVHPESLDLE